MKIPTVKCGGIKKERQCATGAKAIPGWLQAGSPEITSNNRPEAVRSAPPEAD